MQKYILSKLREYYDSDEIRVIDNTSKIPPYNAYKINGETINTNIEFYIFSIKFDKETSEWLDVHLFYYEGDIYCINYNTMRGYDNTSNGKTFIRPWCPDSYIDSSKFVLDGSQNPCLTLLGNYSMYDDNGDDYINDDFENFKRFIHNSIKQYDDINGFYGYYDDDRYDGMNFMYDYSNYSDYYENSEYSNE